jgi:predicted glycosyltransferase
MLGWAKTWFDAILVHGDPRFARFEETFPLLHELGPPVHYTGFVLRPETAGDRRRAASATKWWCRPEAAP